MDALFVTRDRSELYERINRRVEQMMTLGWIDEVRALMDSEWEHFLKEKKLIGYNEIVDFLRAGSPDSVYIKMVLAIAQRTRHYAKRQHTFWNMLQKDLMQALDRSSGKELQGHLEVINLTSLDLDLYIRQLSKKVGFLNRI